MTTEAMLWDALRTEPCGWLRETADLLQEALEGSPGVRREARHQLSDPTTGQDCPPDDALRRLLAVAEARLAQAEGVSRPIEAGSDEAALSALLGDVGCRLPAES